jgi:hypothetical protein
MILALGGAVITDFDNTVTDGGNAPGYLEIRL